MYKTQGLGVTVLEAAGKGGVGILGINVVLGLGKGLT